MGLVSGETTFPQRSFPDRPNRALGTPPAQVFLLNIWNSGSQTGRVGRGGEASLRVLTPHHPLSVAKPGSVISAQKYLRDLPELHSLLVFKLIRLSASSPPARCNFVIQTSASALQFHSPPVLFSLYGLPWEKKAIYFCLLLSNTGIPRKYCILPPDYHDTTNLGNKASSTIEQVKQTFRFFLCI